MLRCYKTLVSWKTGNNNLIQSQYIMTDHVLCLYVEGKLNENKPNEELFRKEVLWHFQ